MGRNSVDLGKAEWISATFYLSIKEPSFSTESAESAKTDVPSDVAPKFYPVLNSLRRLGLSFGAG